MRRLFIHAARQSQERSGTGYGRLPELYWVEPRDGVDAEEEPIRAGTLCGLPPMSVRASRKQRLMRIFDRGEAAMSEAYRADHVGSLLRPAEVKEARTAFREGHLPLEQLRHIEDRAVLAALERQRSIGVDIFTDGEFRRTGFQNDLLEAVEGFVATARPAVVRIWQGPGGEPQEQGTRQVVGRKLRYLRRLTEDQTRFLKAHAPGPIKMTVPSPNQFPAISFQPGVTDQFYPTRSDLLWELVSIIKSGWRSIHPNG
jgi:methionine synthase II (cobalamin-independent)